MNRSEQVLIGVCGPGALNEMLHRVGHRHGYGNTQGKMPLTTDFQRRLYSRKMCRTIEPVNAIAEGSKPKCGA